MRAGRAGFNQGKIAQVGGPAEVSEPPATKFVAGFVGPSNLLRGDAAEGSVGTRGTFTIRPEKIHLRAPDAPVADDETAAARGSDVGPVPVADVPRHRDERLSIRPRPMQAVAAAADPEAIRLLAGGSPPPPRRQPPRHAARRRRAPPL